MSLASWLRRKPCRVPAPRSVRPRLEVLEDRLALSTLALADGGTAPPSQQQALLSLFIDGAAWEAMNLAGFEFIHGDDFNIDNFFGTPSQLAVVRANAAAAGINYDTAVSLNNVLLQIRDFEAIRPDIAANVPYAGPFAEVAVFAGIDAVLQAAKLSDPEA